MVSVVSPLIPSLSLAVPEKKTYTKEQVLEATRAYFSGDELSADVWVEKYALRNEKGEFLELTPTDMHHRLAKEFARIEAKYPNPMREEEIFALFDKFKYVIPQGSPMASIGNPYQLCSLSNCFTVASPWDSYGGITLTDQEIAQIQKRRGGVGASISTLRPKNAPVKNAAKTTDGIGVYMERFSNTTREVAQSGRRGALMLTIDCRHPEILTFINIKRDLTKVTGANISIQWRDDFLQAVEKDESYVLRWPCHAELREAAITKLVRAKAIWDAFVESAWSSAEPGCLFWDTVLNESCADCYSHLGFETVATNPCFAPGTMVHTKNGHFPIESLPGKTVEIWDGKEWIACSNFRVTGENKEILKVTLQDGSFERVTFKHIAILEDGTRKEVKLLKIGERLKRAEAPLTYGGKSTSDAYLKRSTTVASIEADGVEPRVFCCTIPSTNSLALSSGILWGQCSELPLSAYDSCRLTLLNLMGYVSKAYTEEAKFDYDLFGEHARKAQRLMDDLVDLELEAIEKIQTKIESDPEPQEVKQVEFNLWHKIKTACENGRRTGLGITALGDCLAALGITYGDKIAIEVTDKIYKSLAVMSELSSIEMAKERGAFPLYRHLVEEYNPYLRRVFDAANYTTHAYEAHGRRNISNTTTPPAGSTSLVALLLDGERPIFQTTSGIEPVAVDLVTKRRRKISGDAPDAQVDFIDASGDKWQEYEVKHPGLTAWTRLTGNNKIEESPYYKATSRDIDWIASVDMQAAAQKWVSHAISKTINLPKDVTKETVSEVYLHAWRSGCKGATVYREGSRSGVIVDRNEGKKKTTSDTRESIEVVETHAPKRPEQLPCDIHHVTIKGEKWLILVGLMGSKPYEAFGGLAANVELPKKFKSGRMEKRPKKKDGESVYDLFIDVKDDDFLTFRNVVAQFDNPTYGSFTRAISLSLRHGVPVQFVVEQLLRDKTSDVTSFSAVLARVLKRYIKDGAHVSSEKICPKCSSSPMTYSEGCMSCRACGWSKC